MLNGFPSVFHCMCSDTGDERRGHHAGDALVPSENDVYASYCEVGPEVPRQVESLQDSDIVTYSTGLHFPVFGPQVRCGEVWHLPPNGGKKFERAVLCLHNNGFILNGIDGRQLLSVSWSPFSLVQSCRLHSKAADKSRPLLRLFRISIFSQAWCHVFAVEGKDADKERAQWVAEIARVLRMLTQSLFPPFSISARPLHDARWTNTRLLAGYLLLSHESGVLLLYCELHSHWDLAAAFNAYVDERCNAQVLAVKIRVNTTVSEVIGVDCSCFSIHGKHFSARTSAEKVFWLRAISNIKVKLESDAVNPTSDEISAYRESIITSARTLEAEKASSRLPGTRSKGREVVKEPSVDTPKAEEGNGSDEAGEVPAQNSVRTASTEVVSSVPCTSSCSSRYEGVDPAFTEIFVHIQRAPPGTDEDPCLGDSPDCGATLVAEGTPEFEEEEGQKEESAPQEVI